MIERLAKDLKREFPDISGFSSRNLKYMRTFAEAYQDEQPVAQFVAQIPWGHNVRILDYVKDQTKRLWYAREAVAKRSRMVGAATSWSCKLRVLSMRGRERRSRISIVPSPHSDLAQQLIN